MGIHTKKNFSNSNEIKPPPSERLKNKSNKSSKMNSEMKEIGEIGMVVD